MENHNWEYINDSISDTNDYDDYMSNGTYIDDEYELEEKEWQDYYQEISEEIKVERIGFGIPMGGNLEYLDSMTITKALENRKRLT